MNKAIKRSEKALKAMSKARGASMVEYALLLFGVLIVGAAVITKLGGAVKNRASSATTEIGN